MASVPEVPPPTRRCAGTGQELPPGADYRAELSASDQGWARKDYIPAAWPGPRAELLAWWHGRAPGVAAPKNRHDDPARLLALLDREDGADDEAARALRFAAAMALYRARALRLQGVGVEDGRETLTFVRGRGRTVTVVNPGLDEAALAEWEAAAWAQAAA